MSAARRPVLVTVVAWLYIVIGAVALAVHLPGLLRGSAGSGWAGLVEALAVVAGIFLLRRQNWARWLAVAWMAFHVAISYPVARELAVHGIFLAVIAWILFRPAAGRYFGRGAAQTRPGGAAGRGETGGFPRGL